MTDDREQTAVELLQGAIDSHVHGAPDIVDRLMTVVELAEDAATYEMGGLLLLNHYSDTTPQAAIVDSLFDDIQVEGGLKLNRPSGGLNPDAVRIALDLGAVKFDMPTQHAANELRAKGKDPAGGISVTEDGELRPVVHDILSIVADSSATIATGHLSSEEVEMVVTAALDHGIDRPVISHPTLPSIDLPVETQVHLADQGAIVEYCYVNTTTVLQSHFDGWEPLSPSAILQQAEAVGPESAILATDFGQSRNPAPAAGLLDFIADALSFGFGDAEIRRMVSENPREVYGFA